MKAKEYYEKFICPTLIGTSDEEASDEELKFLTEIMKAFNKETVETIQKRHIKKDASLASLIREMNGKWNALRNICVEKHGSCILAENGFKKYWEAKLGADLSKGDSNNENK